MAQAMRTEGDVVIAVRSEFAQAVVRQVARSYFDRVTIDLRDIDVFKQGDLRKQTPLGKMRVGAWAMDMRVHRVRGVLRAGEPDVDFREGNRVQLAFPVHLEEGQGRATMGFAYDSKGLANLVCKDFQAEQTVQGGVIPEDYPVQGSFTAAHRSRHAHGEAHVPRRVPGEARPRSRARGRPCARGSSRRTAWAAADSRSIPRRRWPTCGRWPAAGSTSDCPARSSARSRCPRRLRRPCWSTRTRSA